MSDINTGNKILGFIPRDKYVKITYLLILGVCFFGLLSTFLAVLGMPLAVNGLITLVSFVAIIMALAGFFFFKNEFSPLDLNHLKYICVIFAVFFVVKFILGTLILTITPMIFMTIAIIINIIQLYVYFVGFNSWRHGRMITKDNFGAEARRVSN